MQDQQDQTATSVALTSLTPDPRNARHHYVHHALSEQARRDVGTA